MISELALILMCGLPFAGKTTVMPDDNLLTARCRLDSIQLYETLYW